MAGAVHPGELLDRVQDLSERVDELTDVRARTLAQELMATVIAMYGDGLSRMIEVIADSREAGATILDQFAQDGAVASLLLIHDLYPVPLRDRVIEALDTVRPYMESHGGNVELASLEDGVAKLVLEGSCNGCAASRATLELAIKQALDEHAPDLAGLEVEGVTEPAVPDSGIQLPMAGALPTLPMVHSAPSRPSPTNPEVHATNRHGNGNAIAPVRWIAVEQFARPAPGGLLELSVDGSDVLFADVGDTLLAYANECAACGEALGHGQLDGGMLRCPNCDVAFDLPRAGRAAGGEPLQLRPVPLLEAGGLRVAV
jgi:Fe-S cluster biogenesis protein NfuA/nitrite reductase/ring-hydroxylating ferredoxin subunit